MSTYLSVQQRSQQCGKLPWITAVHYFFINYILHV